MAIYDSSTDRDEPRAIHRYQDANSGMAQIVLTPKIACPPCGALLLSEFGHMVVKRLVMADMIVIVVMGEGSILRILKKNVEKMGHLNHINPFSKLLRLIIILICQKNPNRAFILGL